MPHYDSDPERRSLRTYPALQVSCRTPSWIWVCISPHNLRPDLAKPLGQKGLAHGAGEWWVMVSPTASVRRPGDPRRPGTNAAGKCATLGVSSTQGTLRRATFDHHRDAMPRSQRDQRPWLHGVSRHQRQAIALREGGQRELSLDHRK